MKGFMSDLLDFISALCQVSDWTPSRPRRVFSRRFVFFMVLVAAFELVLLNHYWG